MKMADISARKLYICYLAATDALQQCGSYDAALCLVHASCSCDHSFGTRHGNASIVTFFEQADVVGNSEAGKSAPDELGQARLVVNATSQSQISSTPILGGDAPPGASLVACHGAHTCSTGCPCKSHMLSRSPEHAGLAVRGMVCMAAVPRRRPTVDEYKGAVPPPNELERMEAFNAIGLTNAPQNPLTGRIAHVLAKLLQVNQPAISHPSLSCVLRASEA